MLKEHLNGLLSTSLLNYSYQKWLYHLKEGTLFYSECQLKRKSVSLWIQLCVKKYSEPRWSHNSVLAQVLKVMKRRIWHNLASILRYSRWQLSGKDMLIDSRRISPINPRAAPDHRPQWRELQSAGAHLYSVRVTMAALLKVLTAVSRTSAAASLSQTPAVLSPAALRLRGTQQRNCKWTNAFFDRKWMALFSVWRARRFTRRRRGAEAAGSRCGSGDSYHQFITKDPDK